LYRVVEARRVFEVSRVRRAVGVGKAAVSLARSERITFLAAAIAYYAFASVVPLVLLTAVVASVVGGEAFARDLVAVLGETLTPASQDVLLGTLTTTAGRGSATLVGVVVLLWSSLKVFRALDTAFSMIYGQRPEIGFLDAVVDGVVALVAVGVAIGGSLTLVAVLTLFNVPSLQEVGVVVEVFLLAAAFYPLYYLFPGVDVSYGEVLPGAVLAAVGWAVLSGLFQYYVENAANFALWGVLGVALVVTTWLYVGALLLLVGATTNAVYAGRATPGVEPGAAATADRHLQNEGMRQDDQAMGTDDRDGRDRDADDAAVRDDDAADAADARPSDAPTAGTGGGDDDAVTDVDDGSHGERGDGDDDSRSERADGDDEPSRAELRAEIEALRAELDELDELREELDEFEDDVEDRTLHGTPSSAT
jgi:YihY family inner membrane protein